MRKKSSKIICLILIFTTLISVYPAYSKKYHESFAYERTEKFGNLVSVILEGGYSADCSNGILYSNAEDSGKLYLRELDSENKVRLSDKSASYINAVEDDIFFVCENEIIRLKIGGEEEILYSSADEILYLYASENGMYFLENNQVKYFDFDSKSCCTVYENEKMFAFVPSENGDIYWLEKKEETVDTASCHGLYEGTEETDTDFNSYFFNSSDGTSSEISFYDVLNSNSIPQNSSDSLRTLKLSLQIGDKKIPTEEYPVGSYFTDSGEPCEDHNTDVCGYETEDKCNCKAFYNNRPLYAIQCYGYARYLYFYLFGQLGLPGSENNVDLGTLTEGNVTVESFKELFKNAKPGSQMRVTYYKNDGETISNHSLIILDWNEDGFSSCESNLDAHCGVFVKKRLFEEYVPTLISVDLFIMPEDYPVTEEETTSPEVEKTEPVSDPSQNKFLDFFKNIEISDEFFSSFGEIIKNTAVFLFDCFSSITEALISVLSK